MYTIINETEAGMIYFVESVEPSIHGYYFAAASTDETPDEWVWRDCGSGPEVVNSSVFGPYGSCSSAEIASMPDDD